MTLLELRRRRAMICERERIELLERLRAALPLVLPPGTRLWVYGSLAKPGHFHEDSDIDIAVDDPSGTMDLWRVMNTVAEHTGRETDACRIQDLWFGGSVRRDGLPWTI